jgi:hypothetical protein
MKKYQQLNRVYINFAHIVSKNKIQYSLRSIILFTNIDISRYILVIDTSVLEKNNMNRREYLFTKNILSVIQ